MFSERVGTQFFVILVIFADILGSGGAELSYGYKNKTKSGGQSFIDWSAASKMQKSYDKRFRDWRLLMFRNVHWNLTILLFTISFSSLVKVSRDVATSKIDSWLSQKNKNNNFSFSCLKFRLFWVTENSTILTTDKCEKLFIYYLMLGFKLKTNW